MLLSILLAEKISELGRQVGKPIYYVLNRIADQGTKEFLLNAVDTEKVIAIIPEDKEMLTSGLAGSEINIDVKGIKTIADMLESKKRARIKA